MDQLTMMRSFVGVTKSRSFSLAARGLAISPSLVSRHIAELERILGVRLINRTARTLSLTGAGVRYAEFAARIIDEVDQHEAALRGTQDKPEGPLAIISPKWIGTNDVGDAIVAFSLRYPKIHIRFEVGGIPERPQAFVGQGFDVAFHTRQVRESSLMLWRIADLDFTLCASPRYLRRAGWPAQVSELTAHDCLVNTNDLNWQLRRAGHNVHLKIADPVYSSNSYLTLRKAALADRGVALLPVRLVSGALADGSLLRVLPDWEAPDRPLYALHSPGGQTPVRVRLFLDFVTEWFRRHDAEDHAGIRQLA